VKKHRVILYLIAALVVVAALSFLPRLLPTGGIKSAVERNLSQALGVPVHIATLRIRVWPLPGLVLTGFELRGPGPELRAASAIMSLKTDPLLHGHVVIKRVKLRNAILRISVPGGGTKVLHIRKMDGPIVRNGLLRLPRWQAWLYGGKVRFSVGIRRMRSGTVHLRADVHGRHLDAGRLLADAAGMRSISGTMDCDLWLAARATGFPGLRRHLRVNGLVRMRRGRIRNIRPRGVLAAVVMGGKIGRKGIAYEELRFRLRFHHGGWTVDPIVLHGRRLKATGFLHVDAKGSLRGRLQTSGARALTVMQLRIDGTLAHPGIHPSTTSFGNVSPAGTKRSRPHRR